MGSANHNQHETINLHIQRKVNKACVLKCIYILNATACILRLNPVFIFEVWVDIESSKIIRTKMNWNLQNWNDFIREKSSDLKWFYFERGWSMFLIILKKQMIPNLRLPNCFYYDFIIFIEPLKFISLIKSTSVKVQNQLHTHTKYGSNQTY